MGRSVFDPGDILYVNTTGGDVPAFQGSVMGPGCVSLTAPQQINHAYVISTSQDLQISWTGGQAGAVVHVDMNSQHTQAAEIVDVFCSFQATAGSVTVPQAALAYLANGSPSLSNFGAYQEMSSVVDAGSYQINVLAWNWGHSPNDAGACHNNAPAMFQ